MLSFTSLSHRGPGAVQMESPDDAVATAHGLQVGTHRFRLTVTDRQGLSSTTTLTVAVKKSESWLRGEWVCFPVSQTLSHAVIVQKRCCYLFTADAELRSAKERPFFLRACSLSLPL